MNASPVVRSFVAQGKHSQERSSEDAVWRLFTQVAFQRGVFVVAIALTSDDPLTFVARRTRWQLNVLIIADLGYSRHRRVVITVSHHRFDENFLK